MIEANLPRGSCCFSTVYDPAVAAQAHAAGVGSQIDVSLGGKLDGQMHGIAPIVETATVRVLSDGEFRLVGPMATNATGASPCFIQYVFGKHLSTEPSYARSAAGQVG
jgi:microcystin degradation protein MlrC